jgi:hypothetical protein
MCFIVHKTTSEQERGILTTLYLAGAKNTDKDIPVPMPEASLDEDNPVPERRALLGKDDLAPTSEVNPGEPAEPIKPNLGPKDEIAVFISCLAPRQTGKNQSLSTFGWDNTRR